MNDPASNAYVLASEAQLHPIVVLTSGLVTLLDVNEMAFAIGHELGHYGFRHAQKKGGSGETELEALRRRSVQRCAEVSADRVGLLATGSVFVAARVMLKVASGLPTELLGLDVDAFVRQADRDPDEVSREWELDTSHPSLPLRLWALIRFASSTTFAELSGQGRGGRPIEEIEREIEHRMAALGDGRLSGLEQRAFELALLWAATALVLEGERVARNGRAALVHLVGGVQAAKALDYAKSNGRASTNAKLVNSLERLNTAGHATRRRFDEAFSRFSLSVSSGAGVAETTELVRDMRKLPLVGAHPSW